MCETAADCPPIGSECYNGLCIPPDVACVSGICPLPCALSLSLAEEACPTCICPDGCPAPDAGSCASGGGGSVTNCGGDCDCACCGGGYAECISGFCGACDAALMGSCSDGGVSPSCVPKGSSCIPGAPSGSAACCSPYSCTQVNNGTLTMYVCS